MDRKSTRLKKYHMKDFYLLLIMSSSDGPVEWVEITQKCYNFLIPEVCLSLLRTRIFSRRVTELDCVPIKMSTRRSALCLE